MASRVFRATAAMINVLHKVLGLSIHVEGLENITERPTLFVVNHFTRMETFIVPYVLHKHAGRELRALAEEGLFKGIFGEYLKRMGARSRREPLRNRMIIGDLVAGRHDWVIFPEGVMVKTKQVIRRGKLRIVHPKREGRPHTGAAVLALKATLVRERFLEACHSGDTAVLNELGDRYGIDRDQCQNFPGLVITPVNITFYPLRPNDNLLSRIATGIRPNLSEEMLEELKTEGSLLLKDTDMTIYFSPPIDMQDYVKRPVAVLHKLPFLRQLQKERMVISSLRWPLTRAFMRTIYSTTAINLDHLFCIGLRELKTDQIKVSDFHRALYLSALTIQENGKRRVHDSLHNHLINLITDEVHPALEAIYNLANAEGIVERIGDVYRIARKKMATFYGHEDMRLHGTTRVIANEVEPLSLFVKILAGYVNMPSKKMKSEIVRRLSVLDLECFEHDYALYYEQGLSKSPSIGRPFFLRAPASHTGILLCHGYLAAPEEMRPLGDFLHDAGYTVYGARLQGFGTGPEQLLDVKWEDWLLSFNRAYAILRNCCSRIILGGFSAGALLVLLNAARKKNEIESIFCIDTPLILMDRRACLLTPAVLGWNRVMRKVHLPATMEEAVVNESETPDINYPVHYLSGVRELCELMAVCREALPEVKAPCLIIHGNEDPIADPQSADVVYEQIGSVIKEQIIIDADYHNLVQQEGREQIFRQILHFITGQQNTTMKREEVA